jgi:hypothetical protein
VRKRYVFRDGQWVEFSPDMLPSADAPMVINDIDPYRSMQTGEVISSRSRHREHLKAHGLIEVGNETKYLAPKPKQLPPGLKETIARIAYEKLRY